MKIKFWILATTLALTALASAATNDLTGLLQKGLFDEEANRDLNAAIADYQSVASAFDKDRQLAATAIFRLGECYRKLGKNNEATVQYQRIIKEFDDQPTLVTLSRQNLAGMGVSIPPPGSTAGGVSDVVQQLRQQMEQAQAQIAKDRALLQTLAGMNQEKLRQTITQFIPDTQMDELEMRLNQANQDLIKVKQDFSPEHPRYKAAEQIMLEIEKRVNERASAISNGVAARMESENNYMDALSEQLDAENVRRRQLRETIATLTAQLENNEKQRQELLKTYLPENSEVVDLTKKIETERLNLSQLTDFTAQSSTPGVTSDAPNPVTDEEQRQIRNIQAMIQNSPDLINAPNSDGQTPLILAAEKGQLVVAKYLLDHGADVNGLSRGVVPLTAAAGNGHKAMAELLLARGADVSGGGLNPLYLAVSHGFSGVAEVLLVNKADVNLRSGTDTSGNRPVHMAARDGRTEMLQLLIKHGADVNVTNAQGYTPLEFAADENQIPAAKILLTAKANVDAKDKDGYTALHEAARVGNAEMVSLLLNSGAAIDPVNGINTTPLLLAVANGKVDATRVLLEHKADPNHRGWVRNWQQNISSNPASQNWQPITFALKLANNELVKLLLDAGANPEGDSVDVHEASPLFVAMLDKNNVDAVQMLLQHGADPNRAREDGMPPLYAAVLTRQDKPMIPLLLEKGADPNPKNTQYAPLLNTRDPEIGRWLVEHKADVNIRSRWGGTTPLMVANNDTNYIEFLLANGAKADLQDTNGNTALHWAVYSSRTDSIAILLAHKANPNIQNNNGYTPLDLAKEGMDGHIVGAHLTPNSSETKGMELAAQTKIADLLMAAGGLANLPKRDRIEVRRGSNSGGAFTKGSRDWNHYSLLETIAYGYGIISQNTSGEWGTARHARPNLFSEGLRFPDFKNVVIYRRMDASAKETAINVNLEEILKTADCSRDVWLEWGDVVEVPEADHPVDQKWRGLSDQEVTALTNCVTRRVTLRIKGEDTALTLAPNFFQTSIMSSVNEYDWSLTRPSFMLRSVLDNSRLIRVSSDLTRVKVTRIDPQTKKKREWIVDCTKPTEADLWLRDGDVIEVPEK